MQLAYSSNGFTQTDLPNAIQEIAALGYQGIELLADRPHWSPGADERRLRAALDETSLALSNINANTAMVLGPEGREMSFEPSLSHHDPQVRAQRIRYTERCLELAARLGAPCVSITSGRIPVKISPEEGMDHFEAALRPLCRRAEELGLCLGIESEPGLLVERSQEVLEMIQRIDSPVLGANLDLGHLICVGEEPEWAISLLADRIWNIHIEDIRGAKHYHRIPGEGDINFSAVLEVLRKVGYESFLTVELYTCSDRAVEAARQARAYLQPLLEAL